MTQPTVLSSADLEKLTAFDSCTISNAIERFSAAIGLAPNCVGCVTNGAVQMYASYTSVAHADADIADFGQLHRHGIVAIPLSIATEVPKVASDIQQQERESRFSLQGLSERIRNIGLCCDLPRSGAE
jgi:hypothetical protein